MLYHTNRRLPIKLQSCPASSFDNDAAANDDDDDDDDDYLDTVLREFVVIENNVELW